MLRTKLLVYKKRILLLFRGLFFITHSPELILFLCVCTTEGLLSIMSVQKTQNCLGQKFFSCVIGVQKTHF